MTPQGTVILVEDEDELRRTIDFTLRRNGFRVKSFKEPHMALLSMAGSTADSPVLLLITDVHMPAMSGVELVEKLRSAGSTLPVLIITGQANRHEREKLGKLGVVRILEKPFSLDELVAEVRQICEALVKPDSGKPLRNP